MRWVAGCHAVFMPVFPTFILIDWLDDVDGLAWGQGDIVTLQLLEYFLLGFARQCRAGGSHRADLGRDPLERAARLHSGSWPVHSNVYCGKWLVNQIRKTAW